MGCTSCPNLIRLQTISQLMERRLKVEQQVSSFSLMTESSLELALSSSSRTLKMRHLLLFKIQRRTLYYMRLQKKKKLPKMIKQNLKKKIKSNNKQKRLLF